MDWPPINVPILGRSGLIALIALVHIPFFVNFVMGAPVLAVITEWLGKKTGNPHYDRFSKTLALMALVTVGVGAFGGVGLVATNIGLFPQFFSTGARIFFWPLFVEIGFFLTEAVFIALYLYTYEKLAHRPIHMLFGLLGAFGAWMSGVLINGLASFMLTPGRWIETRNVMDAMFNPSFFPSIMHRGLAAFSITGFFLIVYSLWKYARAKDDSDRDYASWALQYSGKWALVTTALQFFPGVWYLYSLEVGTANIAPEGSVVPKFLGGEVFPFWFGGIALAALAILVVWFFAVQNPQSGLRRTGSFFLGLSVIFILTTNAFMGFSRERARKPYLVYGLIYGNESMTDMMKSIFAAEETPEPETPAEPARTAPAATEEVPAEEAPPGEESEGMALFQQYSCIACHTLNGQGGQVGPDLTEIGGRLSAEEIRDILQDPPPGMPPFTGTNEELNSLVQFLAGQE